MNNFLLLLSLGSILAPCDAAKKIGVIKKGIQKQMPTTREKRFHFLKENDPYVNKGSYSKLFDTSQTPGTSLPEL